MTVERGGVELCEAVDLVHVAVDAVGHRDVNQTVVGALFTIAAAHPIAG